jgi:hypothetical protein
MKLASTLFAAAAAVGLAGAGVGALAVQSASANPTPSPRTAPIVLTYTNVQKHAIPLSPRVILLEFNEYSATTTAPGFAHTANLDVVCFYARHIGVGVGRCDFALTETAAPHNDLEGTAVTTATGATGRVTHGSEAWTGAEGTVVDTSIAPNTSHDVFTITLPVHPEAPEAPAPLPT